MATPKTSPTMVSLHDGRVLVFGGPNFGEGLSGCKRSAELYDPATNTWVVAASMHQGRCSATTVVLRNGRVLVAGGLGYRSRRSAELYHPVTDRWSATGAMHVHRSGAVGSLLPDGRVLVAGGTGGTTRPQSAELYNPRSGHWRLADPKLPGIDALGWVRLRSGNLMVIGCDRTKDPHLRVSVAYVARRDLWRRTGQYRADSRCGWQEFFVQRMANGKVMAIDGREVHRYDPTRQTWRRVASLPPAVRALYMRTLMSVDGRPMMLAIRISCDPVQGLGVGFLWRPGLHRWVRWTTMPTALHGFTALHLHDGSTLFAGGAGPSTACGGPAGIPTRHAVRYYPNR